jgi:hypothetical protein
VELCNGGQLCCATGRTTWLCAARRTTRSVHSTMGEGYTARQTPWLSCWTSDKIGGRKHGRSAGRGDADGGENGAG